MIRIFSTTALLAFVTAAPLFYAPQVHAQDATPTQEQTQQAEYDILGFRSAHFGMNQDQVREAIEKDFGLSGDDAIRAGKNMVTRTESLSVVLSNLLPNTGKVFVSYIFGYQSKGLIQVNIVWNSAEDDTQAPETILGIGGSLQSYFLKQNFADDKVVSGIRLDDRSILLLRASDADNHTVGLVLDGLKENSTNEEPNVAPDLLLKMSYQANPETPDIYVVPDGAF